MKEISIQIDDDVYRRAAEKITDLETQLNQRVTEYLESLNGDDERIVTARSRMAHLFAGTKNFTVGVRPTRQEMHER